MARKCQSQSLFGKSNRQDAVRTYKAWPSMVHCFSKNKTWKQTEIMGDFLGFLNLKLRLEGWKIILFLDNALFQPETLQNNLTNRKFIYLPKRITSRLQLLDADIIRAFKCKYRKCKAAYEYVVPRIDEGRMVSEIIPDVNIVKAIHFL